MGKFILNKLAYGILVLIGVVFIVFALFNLLPVDPARLTLGQRADVASVEAINKELGLDKPFLVKLKLYLNDISPISVYENTPENQTKYHYTKIISLGESALVIRKPYLDRKSVV